MIVLKYCSYRLRWLGFFVFSEKNPDRRRVGAVNRICNSIGLEYLISNEKVESSSPSRCIFRLSSGSTFHDTLIGKRLSC